MSRGWYFTALGLIYWLLATSYFLLLCVLIPKGEIQEPYSGIDPKLSVILSSHESLDSLVFTFKRGYCA